LHKMFLPLKVKLLSPWVGVECLNVLFSFHLTGRYHVGEEFFEGNPHTYADSQSDESELCDGKDFSDSN